MRQLRGRKSLINGKAGSATVEMALVLPLFLLLVFGVAEFGRAWMIINTMHHAAREAVRVAATTASLTADYETGDYDPVTCSTLGVVDRAKCILEKAGITGAEVYNTAPIIPIPPDQTPPLVTVNIVFTYNWMTQIGPLLGINFTGSIPLTSAATMRYER